jgi:hypothetical protein
MDASIGWLGVASLAIHALQGGWSLARRFKLHSKCCGVESAIDWDIEKSPEKDEPLKINIPAHQGALETSQGK